ncbi:hypothetical protein HIM_02893 [Hirsutella minnesotensis 3608]|nr:hypothetical protein HIM_02893 [Hirsutella minnesotensis 3608]
MRPFTFSSFLAGVGLVSVSASATSSQTGVPLFHYEREQLHIRQPNRDDTRLFAFDTRGPSLHPGQCRPQPGDREWPTDAEWNALGKVLNGALVRTVPLAAPCYENWGIYDARRCDMIRNNWTSPYLHENDPTSGMWPLWQGQSCPPTNSSGFSRCTLGGYPVYAVNATRVSHIQLAVNFARNKGLRLVIKNTGHDYQGKSLGAGSLSIWTHNLQDLEYLPAYKQGKYVGKAVHVGAGVRTEDMAKLADRHDASVVGGMCASVGFAGGYFTGGGHSPLSSLFGTGADHVLAIRVVTADGRFITATEETNSELFWALRGGGGSTFGVTTSVVVRLHPKLQTTTSRISFKTSDNVSSAMFWQGVRAYFESFERMTSAGIYAFTNIRRNSSFYEGASYSLGIEPIMAPNSSISRLNTVMKPFFDKLKLLGIQYEHKPRQFDSFYPAWTDAWPASQLEVGEPAILEGSRFFPRNVWNNAAGFEKSFQAIKKTSEDGYDITAFAMSPKNPFNVRNAVNPALRNTLGFFTTGILLPNDATVEQTRRTQRHLMNDVLQPWRDAAPASKLGGSYLNEGSVSEPNWQQDFFGSSYPQLLRIKRQWDPSDVFYATAGVGSERWEVRTEEQGIQTQNGPLCRR